MDLQRTILVVALAVVGYLLILQWNNDYNQPSNAPAESTTLSSPALPASAKQPSANSSDAPQAMDAATPAAPVDQPKAATGQLVTLTSDVLEIEIDPRGGDIVKTALLAYPRHKETPDQPFVLLERTQQRTFVAQSGLTGRDGPDRNGHPLYSSEKTSYSLEEGQDSLVVDLTLVEDGVTITKRYTLTRGQYDIEVEHLVDNGTDRNWQANFYAQLKRDSSGDPSNQGSATSFSTYIGAAVRTADEPYHKLSFDDFSSKPFKETLTGGYAAILQHYFVAAWVPDANSSHTYQTRTASSGDNIIGLVDGAMVLEPGQKGSVSAKLYAGPKLQDRLEALSPGLELTVDYGILWFIAQPLFVILTFIHSFVGNWGWAIILLTVMVKAVFYPLSAASYRSMANMRRVSPMLAKLKEQFGDDRQKMSQAMMELYRKEKINPLGGCLPILVQMPVFIALYWTLLESVELRQAPFMLWIDDLSQMDPYFILPLIMGASMFVQQQLNPTPPDPIQARVMKMMPVIFTFFFLWFPSGLVIYWVVNNLLSILQQWMITRQIEAQAAAR
ncbi:membrane protein insertase YidC [Aestuariirhabdus litorea]|uniref:Membrane protein insertase YidC n=1 Tax=Aestuariirhabdus litorea TaxID=2528527 RepID=A0A3P3VIQ8_9GAMM|nr:membrane protein insertase YidC [Aestuariirhabdus litorea]RRJ82615.1 membrane protein insertase YidC [Aestuariirhabdus litorea]RWW92774.1 membrane protein insertase YidC [Endozoicomonadaceae bacterium GTF-13]